MAETIDLAPDVHALRLSRERAAGTQSGYPMLLVLLIFLAGIAAGVAWLPEGGEAPALVLLILSTIGFIFEF